MPVARLAHLIRQVGLGDFLGPSAERDIMEHCSQGTEPLVALADIGAAGPLAGLAVTLFSAGFFLVGRAMDEVVNPRLRSR